MARIKKLGRSNVSDVSEAERPQTASPSHRVRFLIFGWFLVALYIFFRPAAEKPPPPLLSAPVDVYSVVPPKEAQSSLRGGAAVETGDAKADTQAQTDFMHCAPVFIPGSYRPSTLETEWLDSVARLTSPPVNTRRFCESLISPTFRDRMQGWMTIATGQNAVRPTTAEGLLQQAAEIEKRGEDVFSRMSFKDTCTGVVTHAHMAPLAGILRDPRGPCLFSSGEFVKSPLTPLLSGGPEMLQVKDTTVVDPAHITVIAKQHKAAAALGQTRRVILMDAGASTYNQGVVYGEWPGTRWLVERYRDLGLEFTDIFAWEMTAHPGNEFFEGMSPKLIGATRFYNFGVAAAEGPANPLTVLKTIARPGDYVVFKLDIDTPSVETPLVEQFLKDAEAQALVTDFYYELHFGLVEMEAFWGGGMPGDLLSAAKVFSTLREKGVKAQFWP